MKYFHLVQQHQFCAAASIQMILLRREKLVDQEEIATNLNIRVLDEQKDLYVKTFEALPKGHPLLGFKFERFKEEAIRNALEQYGLTYTVHQYSDLTNPKELIQTSLEEGKDVLANYFHEPINGKQNGHFVLIEELHDDLVTICDPGQNAKPRWTIKLDTLVLAMKEYNGRERGFIIFD